MKIDFNHQFKNLKGKVIREPPKNDKDEGEIFTLRSVCVNALLNPVVDKSGKMENLKGEEKVGRYQFAMKLHNSNGLVDIRPEEQVLLKKLVGEGYLPLIVGQAWEVLDPHEAGDKK